MKRYDKNMRVHGEFIHYVTSFRWKPVKNKPLLVFLHPTALDSRVWKYQWDFFSDYPLLAIDLPGFGKSLETRRKKVTPEFYQKIITEFMKNLKFETTILIGNSLGAAVALSLFPHLRDKIKAFVLISSLTPSGFSSGFFKRAGTSINRIPVIQTALNVLLPFLPLKKFINLFFILNFENSIRSLKEEGYEDAIEEFYSHPKPILKLIEITRHFSEWSLLEEIYKEIDIPVLIFWGRKDKILPLSSGEELSKKLLTSEMIVFPSAGHLPQLEFPHEFNQELDTFLKRIGPKNELSSIWNGFFQLFKKK